VAEVAPDGKTDSTRYNAVGNPEWGLTRRGDTLRTRYDALNRPLVSYHSATRYEANRWGIPSLAQAPGTACPVASEIYQTHHSYPQYPTNTTDCSYTLPADSSVFAYDEAGNVVRADNGDALVRREYDLNGTLAWDSLYIRTLDGASGDPASFEPHRYLIAYEYDLNGRRRSLAHPAQLAQGTNGTTRYTYAPGSGEPETVVDPLNNVFRYEYDVHGQLESLRLPGAVQGFAYDADGQLERYTAHVPAALATAPVNNTVYSYDQRGKMLRSRNLAVEKEEMTAAYSGLGHLVEHRRTASAQNQIQQMATQTSVAWYRHDALGNVRETINSTNTFGGSSGVLTGSRGSSSGTTGGVSQYETGTGRLLRTAQAGEETQYVYDAAGNQLLETNTSTGTGGAGSTSRRDRATFYSADGRLRTAEVRQLADVASPVHGTWEQYRYDALGRRVWVRTRKFCNEENPVEECGFSTVRRIVWDGDQVLHEIRMADSERENDGAPTRLDQNPVTSWDPNPGLGRVLLTHGTGLDQPLSAIRMGYTEWGSHGWGFAFSVIPLWDSRGRAPYAIFGNDARGSNGTRRLAYSAASTAKLTTFWLLAWNAYGPRNNAAVLSTDQQHVVWMSSVMEDQQDASGLLYRRNRYYNPSAGRFTQEDPIGLAGGLNTYGFANSDPVGYSDPYGLCRKDKDGREVDPDCRRIINMLRSVAAEAEQRMSIRSHFSAAADVYERTNREVKFVHYSHWRENTDRRTGNEAYGQTVGTKGPVLLNSVLGEGDLAAVATHEALTHMEDPAASGTGMHFGDTQRL
jgi:RHS repeat-associated protein